MSGDAKRFGDALAWIEQNEPGGVALVARALAAVGEAELQRRGSIRGFITCDLAPSPGSIVPRVVSALKGRGFNVVFVSGDPDPLKLSDGDRRLFLGVDLANEVHNPTTPCIPCGGGVCKLPRTLGWPGGDIDLEPYREAAKGAEELSIDVLRSRLGAAWRGTWAAIGGMKAIGFTVYRRGVFSKPPPPTCACGRPRHPDAVICDDCRRNPPKLGCVGFLTREAGALEGPRCCDRAGEYNGFKSGARLFECSKGCGCHD